MHEEVSNWSSPVQEARHFGTAGIWHEPTAGTGTVHHPSALLWCMHDPGPSRAPSADGLRAGVDMMGIPQHVDAGPLHIERHRRRTLQHLPSSIEQFRPQMMLATRQIGELDDRLARCGPHDVSIEPQSQQVPSRSAGRSSSRTRTSPAAPVGKVAPSAGAAIAKASYIREGVSMPSRPEAVLVDAGGGGGGGGSDGTTLIGASSTGSPPLEGSSLKDTCPRASVVR